MNRVLKDFIAEATDGRACTKIGPVFEIVRNPDAEYRLALHDLTGLGLSHNANAIYATTIFTIPVLIAELEKAPSDHVHTLSMRTAYVEALGEIGTAPQHRELALTVIIPALQKFSAANAGYDIPVHYAIEGIKEAHPPKDPSMGFDVT